MLSNIFLFALTLSPLVSAHGKVTVVTGNAGGNGTALAIQGGVVPGTGPNSKVCVSKLPIPPQPSTDHPPHRPKSTPPSSARPTS